MSRSNRKLLLYFSLLSILVRLVTFFPAVIDHDESTYIIIADQLLHGDLPYVSNLDVKPIGIYLLFAGALTILKQIWVIRLLLTLVVAGTGLLICQVHEALFKRRSTAIAAGVLFILLSALHKWGWSANTEFFFVCCSMGALSCLVSAHRLRSYLFVGLILGIGFLFKYHIVFDIIAFVVFDFIYHRRSVLLFLRDWTIAFMAFICPFAVVWIVYFRLGYLDQFLFATFEIPSNYASTFQWLGTLNFMSEFFLSFAPFSILFIYGLIAAYRQQAFSKGVQLLWVVWLIMAWVGILATGKYYFHYYLQFLAPFCLFLPAFVLVRPTTLEWLSKGWALKYRWPIITAIALLLPINQYAQLYKHEDYTRAIAREIAPQLTTADRIYTNDKNILYFLCQTAPPTRYVHTSLLYKTDLAAAYQIDVVSELHAIANQSPKFLIIKNKPHPVLLSTIQSHYEVYRNYPNDLVMYKRE